MSESGTPRGQTQTALVSIGAAVLLVVLKLGTGIVTGSLALISAGIEASGDVVAAILTLLAIRLGGHPPDREHPYGHRRAENLAALGEAAILSGGGAFVVIEAIDRLGGGDSGFDPRWYVFAVIAVALAVDISRVTVSVRSAARYKSAALRSNAFHFAGDMAGSIAVLGGITAVALGFHEGDAIASLVVAAIIFTAAARLIYENALILMDTTPLEAQAQAEAAIRDLGDDQVELRQLRLRESGGQYFADATIGAAPEQALVASHLVADRVEAAVRRALPDADVVVHVEPLREGLDLRARALAIALAEPPVREAHDIAIYRHEGRCSVSMHLKLDAETPLAAAHEVAERIEAALRREAEVDDVQTHLEPLEAPATARPATDEAAAARIEQRIVALVEQRTGAPPRRLRMLATDFGLVVFLDVVASPEATLEAAHDIARRLERDIRQNRTDGEARIADVVVHTEP